MPISERERNRARMPVVTRFVDALRRFDPEARVLYACEGGLELGAKPSSAPAPPPGTRARTR